MTKTHIAILGKTIQTVARLRGGGSALPGLIIEKISPNFTRDILCKLPYGVVVISGTNGKTTTTKMAVELLESQGLTVFTNRTGSNFSRGVTSSLLREISLTGKIHADIAVLELDEAHAVNFVNSIPPRYCLLLNVLRDQLDRFGEIDNTAKLLEKIAQNTTKSIILNREDERIFNISYDFKEKNIVYYGLSNELKTFFPSDDNFYSKEKNTSQKILPKPSVTLKNIDKDNNSATFKIDNDEISSPLNVRGVYNIYNLAGAIALTKEILKEKFSIDKLKKSLIEIKPAFGRGEVIKINDKTVDIVLVKNPSGFRLVLSSFSSKDTDIMFAINDNYADGRDISWLWDVDFNEISDGNIVAISGDRAYDMALRLQHDEFDINQSTINTNLEKSVDKLLANGSSDQKRIFCTYTAMMKIRKILSNKTEVKKYDE